MSVCENCGKELNEHSKAVTLVTAESFTDTTESSKSCCTLTNLLESNTCIAFYGVTVEIDNSTGMNFFTDSLIIFNLTGLCDGCSTVKVKVEIFISGNTESEGVNLTLGVRLFIWVFVG